MNETRQDAWSKEEDLILAETVLTYIKDGKTQMEAFRDVAMKLSRTAAACGFRWNATIRKEYQEAIEQAKAERKRGVKKELHHYSHAEPSKASIDSAIVLLEKMKTDLEAATGESNFAALTELQEENDRLKKQLQQYEQTVEEMFQLWNWFKNNEA